MENIKVAKRTARARRTHAKARCSQKPRLLVFRSNRTVYAQIMDDQNDKIVCSSSGLKIKATGVKAATEVGKKIAELAKTKKITEVAFDRSGYKYHGQIKALADSAREGGLKF
ncbi:50S ribosomal protein L18 [Candidatus Gracilibacteria bacterium]|nr:50S ribosomal protein L18 [Candidatus Gracilibacteria bacterium]